MRALENSRPVSILADRADAECLLPEGVDVADYLEVRDWCGLRLQTAAAVGCIAATFAVGRAQELDSDSLAEAAAAIKAAGPSPVALSNAESISLPFTLEALAGDWRHIAIDRDGEEYFRRSFTIHEDGTATGYSYDANSGKGTAKIVDNRVQIDVNADWGPFANRPYLKWNLRRDGDDLVGTSDYWYSNDQGWHGERYARVTKRPEEKRNP